MCRPGVSGSVHLYRYTESRPVVPRSGPGDFGRHTKRERLEDKDRDGDKERGTRVRGAREGFLSSESWIPPYHGGRQSSDPRLTGRSRLGDGSLSPTLRSLFHWALRTSVTVNPHVDDTWIEYCT